MAPARRKFSLDEKIAIYNQAQEIGVGKVLKQLNISYSVFARWKQQLLSDKLSTANSSMEQRLKNLTEENQRLKMIIANQALQLDMQTEQLKKFS